MASIGFGGVAIIACFFLEDIGKKMTPKIEIYLENDVQAEKVSKSGSNPSNEPHTDCL